MASLFSLALAQDNMVRGKYINAQTGTTYALGLDDAGAIVTLTNAGAIALTVPTNADAAFATNSIIILIAGGAGGVTVAGDTGVTVNSANSDATLAQNDWGILVKTGTDTWQFTVLGGAGGGGGYAEGTSFPGSPATDDQFFRTDLDLLFLYDGTQWLSSQLFIHELRPQEALPSNRSATTNGVLSCSPMLAPDFDFWIQEFRAASLVITTVNATNYWRFDLRSFVDATGTTVASVDTKTNTAGQRATHKATVNALMGTTVEDFEVDMVKVLSPGNCYILGASIVGRLVAT